MDAEYLPHWKNPGQPRAGRASGCSSLSRRGKADWEQFVVIHQGFAFVSFYCGFGERVRRERGSWVRPGLSGKKKLSLFFRNFVWFASFSDYFLSYVH